MRSIQQTLGRELARDIALVCSAVFVVGLSFGALAVGSGLPWWLPTLSSVLVFAGASQFMFVGIVAAGGSPIAAMLAGLVVNARHVPFGFAVGDLLGDGRFKRVIGMFVMVDETVAFALAQDDPEAKRRAYWASGIGLFVSWNVGVVAGVVGGSAIDDTAALGLDAAFPAVLLALILPMLRDATTFRAALLGAALAVAATPFLPAGLPILIALAGTLVALRDIHTREPVQNEVESVT